MVATAEVEAAETSRLLFESHTCRCGAYLPVYDNKRWPKHNVGDAPDWWGDPPCPLGQKPYQRRAPRSAGKWWEKYIGRR